MEWHLLPDANHQGLIRLRSFDVSRYRKTYRRFVILSVAALVLFLPLAFAALIVFGASGLGEVGPYRHTLFWLAVTGATCGMYLGITALVSVIAEVSSRDFTRILYCHAVEAQADLLRAIDDDVSSWLGIEIEPVGTASDDASPVFSPSSDAPEAVP